MMKKSLVLTMLLSFAAGLPAVLPAAEAAKLRHGVHRSVNGAPDVVAHRLGYFKKFGLEYTMEYFKQGKVMRNAVIQNNLDTAGGVGFSPFPWRLPRVVRLSASPRRAISARWRKLSSSPARRRNP